MSTENKKKLLKETSFAFQSPIPMLKKTEAGDPVVEKIKKAINAKSGFEVQDIKSGNDSFYTCIVRQEITDTSKSFELEKPFYISKIYDFRKTLLTELSKELSIVNINVGGSIKWLKGADELLFMCEILVSNTNVRDWVTGKKVADMKAAELDKRNKNMNPNFFPDEKLTEAKASKVKTLVEQIEKLSGKKVAFKETQLKEIYYKPQEMRKREFEYPFKDWRQDLFNTLCKECKVSPEKAKEVMSLHQQRIKSAWYEGMQPQFFAKMVAPKAPMQEKKNLKETYKGFGSLKKIADYLFIQLKDNSNNWEKRVVKYLNSNMDLDKSEIQGVLQLIKGELEGKQELADSEQVTGTGRMGGDALLEEPDEDAIFKREQEDADKYDPVPEDAYEGLEDVQRHYGELDDLNETDYDPHEEFGNGGEPDEPFEETGLIVRPAGMTDIDKLGQVIYDGIDFWSEPWGDSGFFFPEAKETIPALKVELEKLFSSHGIKVTYTVDDGSQSDEGIERDHVWKGDKEEDLDETTNMAFLKTGRRSIVKEEEITESGDLTPAERAPWKRGMDKDTSTAVGTFKEGFIYLMTKGLQFETVEYLGKTKGGKCLFENILNGKKIAFNEEEAKNKIQVGKSKKLNPIETVVETKSLDSEMSQLLEGLDESAIFIDRIEVPVEDAFEAKGKLNGVKGIVNCGAKDGTTLVIRYDKRRISKDKIESLLNSQGEFAHMT